MKLLLLLYVFLLFLALSPVTAIQPGVDWKPEWVRTIRTKLDFLFDFKKPKALKIFNINEGRREFNKYVFDPTGKTVTPPYDDCESKEACDELLRSIDKHLRFTEAKTLRLLFHDCVPYVGGRREGGCDGCTNF